eukprot:gnl/MRDRNA2_/MRDRNA2_40774_c0_seq1.p1 gnl/MRDRNA2_/MRDRNA2_40774_c0~~gnl/MRDRNA2_/MRDRNA2_40774_c0_seq1.p1  ORF type:complete len:134 (+),score=17.43 gnl/MRDRNA2_/MRDRNA2_40774_c0_seq1:585-986(+)
MQASKLKIRSPLESMMIDGEQVYDKSRWSSEIYRHCEMKYVDNTGRCSAQDLIQTYWVKVRRFHPSAMRMEHALKANIKTNPDSAAGGGESVCASVLVNLPFVVKLLVVKKILERYSYSSTGRTGHGIDNVET